MMGQSISNYQKDLIVDDMNRIDFRLIGMYCDILGVEIVINGGEVTDILAK